MTAASKERVERLRNYISRISPTGQLQEFRQQLEASTYTDSDRAETLDVHRRMDDIESVALETLDLMIRSGTDIDSKNVDSLEAIIHKTERPAVFIINDRIRPLPPRWSFIGMGDIRKRLEAIIPSIGCIEIPNDPDGRAYAGTGFVVGPNLLMTNRHVAEIFATGIGRRTVKLKMGRKVGVDFKREVIPDERDAVVYEIDDVLLIHPYWDMALLRVKGLPAKHAALTLSTAPPENQIGCNIVVVGYPAQDSRSDLAVQNEIFGGVFDVKRLCPGQLSTRCDFRTTNGSVNTITHDSSTLGGNSGSAVIDVDSGNVIGIHFAGDYLKTNFAVSSHDLAQDSQVVDMGVKFTGRVEPRADFYGPIWTQIDSPDAAGDKQNVVAAGGSVPNAAALQQNAERRVVLPLRLEVSLGNATLTESKPGRKHGEQVSSSQNESE